MMRVLFFTPSAGRTGSEVALYNYICHAAGKGLEMAVACGVRGELLGALPPGVPAYVYGSDTLPRRVYKGVRRLLSADADDVSVRAVHEKFKPDVWYVNTITLPSVVRQARRHGIPCVLHTHELEQMIWALDESDTRMLVEYPALVIAGSESARDVFRALGRRDVEVCYENVNPDNIRWSDEGSRKIRESLRVGDGTFVWAMSGTLDPNKNPVRFVETAAEMLGQGLDAHFLWLGGGETGYALYAKAHAERLGVAARVSWLGARREDYYDCLNAADGFVLTSYKESFSLVTVEAAWLGKPVVSFDCGGVKEIVRDGMGTVIDSWNTSDLVRAMAAVMSGEVAFDPRVGRERVREFFIDVQGARWESVMRNLDAPGRRQAR